LQDARPFISGAVMQRYYSSLEAIHQQTMQLDDQECNHCHQTQCLVSHAYVRKKQAGAEPRKVGKRVFCCNRHGYGGCGRTMQLYLCSSLRYLHYTATMVEVFLFAWLAGASIGCAYQQATGAVESRNAYRWLYRLMAQLSVYRSLTHQPPLSPFAVDSSIAIARPRRRLLAATLTALLKQFGSPLCAGYQFSRQCSFL
jgi:hypothetical protein